MNEIPKAYNPIEVEDKWYQFWEENNLFGSKIDSDLEAIYNCNSSAKYYWNAYNGAYS